MANTVKVRIAVAVDKNGEWSSYGGSTMTDADCREYMFLDTLEDGEQWFWLEADLPIPEIQTIQAKVSE